MPLAAWVLPKASMRAAFSASYLSSMGGDEDFSCCGIVKSSDNMVQLGQVYRDGRAAGCKLGLHLAEPRTLSAVQSRKAAA